jgi:hypothetical protein
MSCPYFYPVARLEEDLWAVPPRLPLGDAYTGECRAGEVPHQPDPAVMRSLCSCGYARRGTGLLTCVRFPQDARADAVRFSVAADEGDGIRLQYIFEKECWPLDHGELRYSISEHAFAAEPADKIVARQAIAFVESYLRRAR